MNTEQRQLKRATEKLVKSLGGIEAAAPIIDKSTSTVGRWTNKDDEQHFINAADLRELEANAADPLVTQTLCRLAGGAFIKLPDPAIDTTGLAEQVAAIGAEFGDVCRATAAALANGKLDGLEPEMIESELTDLIERALQMRETVRAIGEKPRLRTAA